MNARTPRTGSSRFFFCWTNICRACYRHLRDTEGKSEAVACFWAWVSVAYFPFAYLFDREVRETAEEMIVDSLALHD